MTRRLFWILSLAPNLSLPVTALCIGLSAGTPAAAQAPAAQPWQVLAEAPRVPSAARIIQPAQATLFRVDPQQLRAVLAGLARTDDVSRRPIRLLLPMPDGRVRQFPLQPRAVMAPALAARYPQIHTFAGMDVNDPRVVGQFDLGPRGLRAQIFTPEGRVYIDPYSRADDRVHQSYRARDLPPRLRPPEVVLPAPASADANVGEATEAAQNPPDRLLTYRIAVATTGEYAQFHDPGGIPARREVVLAEVVTLVNRVSGIYERELGIALQLVADNDRVVFVDPETDPYVNSSVSDIEVNTQVLDARLGLGYAAYDVGHVVNTGQGGVAQLRSVCAANAFTSKGKGASGLPNPTGDAFHVDYVAHEIGHQFDANHTMNGTQANCLANRNPDTAYEPGSGTTIMAYAGVCAEDDLQPNSDPHFHAASFDEILAFVRRPIIRGGARGCAAESARDTNAAPVVQVPAGGFTIPANTPFELTGSATDADGDVLSYQWEQFDLGEPSPPNAPAADSPLFRSFAPTASPTRSFPQLSDLLANTQTIGEILPAVSRSLTFRFSVRDNRFAPSYGTVSSALLTFAVSADAGPFRVLEPNTSGRVRAGRSYTVRWDPAGTAAAPVNCARVDLTLSTDGGQTYPYRLAGGTPNDGSHTLRVPALPTERGRLKIKCSDNVFFDVSDADFAIF